MATDDDVFIFLTAITQVVTSDDEDVTVSNSIFLFLCCDIGERYLVIDRFHGDEDIESQDIFEFDITKRRIEELFGLVARSEFASCFELPEDSIDTIEGFFDGGDLFIWLDDGVHRWHSTKPYTEHIIFKYLLQLWLRIHTRECDIGTETLGETDSFVSEIGDRLTAGDTAVRFTGLLLDIISSTTCRRECITACLTADSRSWITCQDDIVQVGE